MRRRVLRTRDGRGEGSGAPGFRFDRQRQQRFAGEYLETDKYRQGRFDGARTKIGTRSGQIPRRDLPDRTPKQLSLDQSRLEDDVKRSPAPEAEISDQEARKFAKQLTHDYWEKEALIDAAAQDMSKMREYSAALDRFNAGYDRFMLMSEDDRKKVLRKMPAFDRDMWKGWLKGRGMEKIDGGGSA